MIFAFIVPAVGFSVTRRTTVNEPMALLLAASEASITWLPAVDGGTVKVALKVPLALELIEGGVVVTGPPPYVSVMPELAAKPAPVTVACVPTGPEGGFTVSDGEVVNV